MAILQALFVLITRSAGKVVNAMFGWAVQALFGRRSSREQTVLSCLVGLAVAWPVLLVGLVAHSIATLVLAFVHVPRSTPATAVRIVWLSLAVAIPAAVGLVAALRAPPGSPPEPFVKRVLRGYPITAGLASAFILMFVSVPLMRFAALVRGRTSANVPLVTDARAYREVAGALRDVLERHGLELRRSPPGWWVRAPMQLLLWVGGETFRSTIPREVENFTSATLTLSLYPSGALLRGSPRHVATAQALIAEAIIETNGLETVDPAAQNLEREIHDLWKAQILGGRGNAIGASRSNVARLMRELSGLDLEFEQWRALYRQILQVDRTLRGDSQLMESEIAWDRARFAEDSTTAPSLSLSPSELALTADGSQTGA
jgi:hypothetical protein